MSTKDERTLNQYYVIRGKKGTKIPNEQMS